MTDLRPIFDMFRSDPLPADLFVRSYAMRATTANEASRTVDAVLSTENPVYGYCMRTFSLIREILVIEGMKNLPAQVPLLDTHDRSSVHKVLGSTRNLRVEGNQLVGTRHFSSVKEGADAFTKVKEGHLTDGSLGYRPLAYTELEPGASTIINGRSFTNDGFDLLRITTEWMPFEDSVAAIGQDSSAKVRSASNPTPSANPAGTPQGTAMTIEQMIALYGESHRALITKLHNEKMADAQIAAKVMEAVAASARAVTSVPPASVTQGDETVRAQVMAEQRTRISAIRAAAGSDMPAELVNRAIDENWDANRANAEFLAESRRARPAPVGHHAGRDAGSQTQNDPIEVIASSEEKFQRAVEVSLSVRAFNNTPERAPKFTAEQLSEASSLRGVGLQDIARLSLRAHRTAAPINLDTLFARALSTISFPTALGNTLNRVMQQSYETAPSTLLQWASIGSVNDFREHKNIKLGKFARPTKVGQGGQVEHGQIAEEAEGFQAATYATRLSISRAQFINDDLGIFDQVVPELGSSMKMNLDDIGYDLLISASGVGPTLDADSKALFATDHVDMGDAKNGAIANYQTGGTYVLGSAGLTQLKMLLRKIKAGGRLLNLMPKYLLVPAALEQKALELVSSSHITIGGTSEVRGNSNVHMGTVQVIVEPRLDGGTDGATAWYLVCDPVRAKSLQVSFLRGNQSPTIERRDPTDVLGIGWLAYHDAGVDAIDFRGIVRSKGA